MKESQKPENHIWKEIESGKYRDFYLVYNRKSTDEPENQKNSIKYQKSENTRFAYREKLPIANVSLEGFCRDGIISEKHSAFKEGTDLILANNGFVQYRIGRPKFYKLIQLLNSGCFKGVIVLCWDRISRNKGDEVVIRKLMKTRIDFQFVLATYDKTSSGALHMDIDGMFAEHHSRVTSEKVAINIRNQREKGICTYRAPVGYLNSGRMDHKPFDTERAPVIKQLFQQYATGEWTLASLARWANEQGFTMAPMRRKRTKEEILQEEDEDIYIDIETLARPPTYTGIQKILTNPFYIGKIKGNDGTIVDSSSHKPLVSEDIFNKVQSMLNNKKVSIHYSERLQYAYRGMIRCSECGRSYTPYSQKGHIYYGVRCQPGCSNAIKSLGQLEISERIRNSIEKLCLTEKELEDINARAHTDLALLEAKRLNTLELNDRKKRKLREDLSYLGTNKLNLLKTGVYSPEAFLEEENRLTTQLSKLQEEENCSDAAMHETVQSIIKLSELLNNVVLYHLGSNPCEIEVVARFIFSELSFSNNVLKYKCKNGFEALESRFIYSCALQDWLSETTYSLNLIQKSIQDIEAYLNNHSPLETPL